MCDSPMPALVKLRNTRNEQIRYLPLFRRWQTSSAAVWLGLVRAEGSVFIPHPIFHKCPSASSLPAPDRLVFAISLPVGNWIVFSTHSLSTATSRLRMAGRFARQERPFHKCVCRTRRRKGQESAETQRDTASGEPIRFQLGRRDDCGRVEHGSSITLPAALSG
jgi:hypothetical protein